MENPVLMLGGLCLDRYCPVSYTHLDVYKRQDISERAERRMNFKDHAGADAEFFKLF